MCAKVAVVTGSNKGIGFEIVKGLCQKFDGVVYLTSRNEKRGVEAVGKLQELGLQPKFHILDVSNRKSVETFRDYIIKKHGYIDLIVNNASVGCDLKTSYEEERELLNINYFGVINVSHYLNALIRENGRIVNISSNGGHLSNIRNKNWLDTLSKEDLTVAEVTDFVNSYLESVQNGTYNASDFADQGRAAVYRVSKVGVSALTIIYQRELKHKNIAVNSVHLGYVKTDMTYGTGYYTQEEGASAPLHLALEAPQDPPQVYMWHDKTIVDWYDYKSDQFYTWKRYLVIHYLVDVKLFSNPLFGRR